MRRDACDSEVAVDATKAVQGWFDNGVKRLSFDRGFHSPENQTELGLERYVSLAITGRNLRTPGRLLIAQEASTSEAASTRRKAA